MTSDKIPSCMPYTHLCSVRVPSSQVHTELPHCPCPEHWFGQTSYRINCSLSTARCLFSVALSDNSDDWKIFILQASCISPSLSSAQLAKVEEIYVDEKLKITEKHLSKIPFYASKVNGFSFYRAPFRTL